MFYSYVSNCATVFCPCFEFIAVFPAMVKAAPYVCAVSSHCIPATWLSMSQAASTCWTLHLKELGLSQVAHVPRNLCHSNQSRLYNPSKGYNISPAIANFFVSVLAGFRFPSMLPIITCFVRTSSWMQKCLTASCLILYTGTWSFGSTRLKKSHQTLGVIHF